MYFLPLSPPPSFDGGFQIRLTLNNCFLACLLYCYQEEKGEGKRETKEHFIGWFFIPCICRGLHSSLSVPAEYGGYQPAHMQNQFPFIIPLSRKKRREEKRTKPLFVAYFQYLYVYIYASTITQAYTSLDVKLLSGGAFYLLI